MFVYGTLLRGERNDRLLSGCEMTGHGQTDPEFDLYDLGAFPAAVDGGRTAISGEVYEASPATLTRLDQLEGVSPSGDGLYDRRIVRVWIPHKGAVCAWMYVMRGARAERHSRGTIPSGDWLAREAA